jgi:hypothetical protein
MCVPAAGTTGNHAGSPLLLLFSLYNRPVPTTNNQPLKPITLYLAAIYRIML